MREGSAPIQKLRLLKHPDTLPIEGVFTCEAGRTTAGSVSTTYVGIHYPSALRKF